VFPTTFKTLHSPHIIGTTSYKIIDLFNYANNQKPLSLAWGGADIPHDDFGSFVRLLVLHLML
jgi:hypothetical protein